MADITRVARKWAARDARQNKASVDPSFRLAVAISSDSSLAKHLSVTLYLSGTREAQAIFTWLRHYKCTRFDVCKHLASAVLCLLSDNFHVDICSPKNAISSRVYISSVEIFRSLLLSMFYINIISVQIGGTRHVAYQTDRRRHISMCSPYQRLWLINQHIIDMICLAGMPVI